MFAFHATSITASRFATCIPPGCVEALVLTHLLLPTKHQRADIAYGPAQFSTGVDWYFHNSAAHLCLLLQISKKYTHYGAIVLFMYFGLRMLYDVAFGGEAVCTLALLILHMAIARNEGQ